MKLPSVLQTIISKVVRTSLLLIGIFIFVFILMRILPGDIVDLMSLEGGLDEAMKAELRAEMGLDKNLLFQFTQWAQKMFSFDFGNSFRFGKPVIEIIGFSLPVTLHLALLSSSFGLFFGALLAFCAIWKKGGFFSTIVEILNIWSTAVPTFCIGYVLIFIFVLGFRTTHLSGNFLFPVIILSLDIAGQVAKPLYAEMKETLSSRFVTIARSKGVSERWIVIRHVLPNSTTVFLTLSGLIIAGTLGGSMTMEVLFNLPGLGQLAYNAVSGRDYPIIQTLTLLITVVVVIVNLITDILAMLIDPRLREERSK